MKSWSEVKNFFVAGKSLPFFVVFATLGSQLFDSSSALGNLDLGRALSDLLAFSAGMDWWRMEWPFFRVEQYFQRPNFAGTFQEFRRKSHFDQISGSEFWNSEPEKTQFHTPSHSIPPLDSLLLVIWWQGGVCLRPTSMCSLEKYVASVSFLLSSLSFLAIFSASSESSRCMLSSFHFRFLFWSSSYPVLLPLRMSFVSCVSPLGTVHQNTIVPVAAL